MINVLRYDNVNILQQCFLFDISVDFFGSILTPQQPGAGAGGAPAAASANKPLITNDLDSTLASLADSLSMKSNWSPSPAKTSKGTTGNTAVSLK